MTKCWLPTLGLYLVLTILLKHVSAQDTVDLYIKYFQPNPAMTDSDSFIAVQLELGVDLQGAATLEGPQNYTLKLYLSTDDIIDPASDYELNTVPASFSQIEETHEFTESGFLDLSGTGLGIPALHLDASTEKYCGATYIGVFVDNGGGIYETHVENNWNAQPLKIVCPGDIFSITDVSVDLGTYQTELFPSASTPVTLNAKICFMDSTRDFLPEGENNYRIRLFMHTHSDFLTGSPLEVTQPGGPIFPVGVSPLDSLYNSQVVLLDGMRMTISGDKFAADNMYTHLIVHVDVSTDSATLDDIRGNNFRAIPIVVSGFLPTQQVDYQVLEFDVDQDTILADGSFLP
ncbi:unnamed protein product, partial [Owenia fusiformis]